MPPTTTTIPPSCSSGPDHICSDGKCYSQSGGCPTGYTIVSNGTCSCENGCSGTCPNTCTSSVQVNLFICI